MNTEPTSTPTPTPLPTPEPAVTGSALPPPLPSSLQPMEGRATLLNVVEHLLRHPARILHGCGANGWRVIPLLLVVASVTLAVFGFLLGTFSGGVQLWSAPLKVVLGALAAVIICMPSLYIFGALGGLEARLSQIIGVLLAMIALLGMLLLGFAPVVWIFAASTQSLSFMGFLTLVFWLIAISFGARLLLSMSGILGMKSRGYLHLWLGIFTLVTLQMSTSLRPIIGTADTLLPTEKRFFLDHWFTTVQAVTPNNGNR